MQHVIMDDKSGMSDIELNILTIEF